MYDKLNDNIPNVYISLVFIFFFYRTPFTTYLRLKAKHRKYEMNKSIVNKWMRAEGERRQGQCFL